MNGAITPDMLAAYRNTDYRFGRGTQAITLRVGMRSKALLRLYAASGHSCGTFITACNPLGEIQSDAANEAAHARLAAELNGMAVMAIEGAGVDPAGAWPAEKSFFVLGVDLEAARNLGLRYRQNAIVWSGANALPELILLR